MALMQMRWGHIHIDKFKSVKTFSVIVGRIYLKLVLGLNILQYDKMLCL